MKQKEKNKIEKAQKIISYMDIKKREVFGDQKTGAKLLFNRLREGLANWKLNRLRTRVLKAELGAKPASSVGGLLSGARQKVFQELSSYNPFRNMNRKVILRKAFALITIFAVIVTAYWQNNQTASGATK